MSFHDQPILPAVRNMKQFEEFLKSPFTYGVLLDVHLGRLKGIMNEANAHHKKCLSMSISFMGSNMMSMERNLFVRK